MKYGLLIHWISHFLKFQIANNADIFLYLLTLCANMFSVPTVKKCGQTIKTDFSKIVTASNRKPKKKESDRRTEFCNNVFQTFSKFNKIHHFC